MKLITRNELETLLLGITASTIVSMVCVTTPGMRAKSAEGVANPYRIGVGKNATITLGKVNKVNGNISGRYDRIVENRLSREIEAERAAENLPPLTNDELEEEIQRRFRQGTSWHCPVMDNLEPTCLSVNKNDLNGERYLRFVFKAKGAPEYIDLENGNMVANERVNPYLSPVSEYENQGLEDKVIFVCYKLCNIVEIAIGGERYRILDNFAEKSEALRNKAWDIAEEYLSGERRMAKV
jgi:hypothetical protein